MELIEEKINKWLKHIGDNNLKQPISEKDIINNYVSISPFNYSHYKNKKLFINIQGISMYRTVYSMSNYNKGLISDIENNKTRTFFCRKIKKYDKTYSLLNPATKTVRNIIKELKEKDNLKEKNLEEISDKYFTNDVWSMNKKESENIAFTLDEYQQKAYQMVKNNQISVISGYAGVGKSATIKAVSKLLIEEGWSISRIAPTGLASQIIQGRTIHSWLEPIIKLLPNNRIEILGFSKHNLKEKECVIIDECSMIDNKIWSEIMRVWNNSSNSKAKKLIFVGDPGQLEPIDIGSPFIDIINSKKYPITELKNIHRNNIGNGIISMAHFVRRKKYLDTWNKYNNIEFISENKALSVIAENPNIQMITPKRRGIDGSIEINNKIKKIMQIKEKPEFKTLSWDENKQRYIEQSSIHLNDKIIITKNIWDWNITNGTIGIYKGIEKIYLFNHLKKSYSRLRNFYKFYNSQTKKIFFLPSNKKTRALIELAYAITIHKSQGSEFDKSVLFFPNRWIEGKMLYTAITRTKAELLIYYPSKK